MKKSSWWLLGAMIVAASAGCETASQNQLNARAAEDVWLGALRDGTTNKAQIVAKLGEPTATYENNRVLVYRLMHNGNYTAILPEGDPRDHFKGTVPLVMHGDNPIDEKCLPNEWDFVAEFDKNGMLLRHNMLPVCSAWDTQTYEILQLTARAGAARRG